MEARDLPKKVEEMLTRCLIECGYKFDYDNTTLEERRAIQAEIKEAVEDAIGELWKKATKISLKGAVK